MDKVKRGRIEGGRWEWVRQGKGGGKRRQLDLNNNNKKKDLYSENYKILKKDLEEDKNKWKHILCSWIGKINIINTSILLK